MLSEDCQVDEEIDGLYDVDDKNAGEWFCVLTLCVDETIDKSSGMCIVAGYLGRSKNWKDCCVAWREALGSRPFLHLNEMHLNAPNAPKRHGELLRKLAQIPKACGLTPYAGSICEKNYKHLDMVTGTLLELIMEGYILAIIALLDQVFARLSVDERIQVLFERQDAFAQQRERAMTFWNSIHRTSRNKGVVSSWRPADKGTLTEASDYFCYALFQRDINPSSQKAVLTAPILDVQRYYRLHRKEEVVKAWLNGIAAISTKPIPPLTPENRRKVRSGH